MSALIVRIQNLDQVLKYLSPKKAERVFRVTADELLRGAILIEGRARRAAPVETGRLRSSITHRRITDRQLGYEIYTDVEYAAFVEFGTGRRGSGSPLTQTAQEVRRDAGYEYGPRAGMVAQPFMFPAFEQSREEIVKAIGEVVQREAEAGGKAE